MLTVCAETFHEAQAAAIKDLNHKAVNAGEMLDDGGHFVFGENDGETLRFLGRLRTQIVGNGLMEHAISLGLGP